MMHGRLNQSASLLLKVAWPGEPRIRLGGRYNSCRYNISVILSPVRIPAVDINGYIYLFNRKPADIVVLLPRMPPIALVPKFWRFRSHRRGRFLHLQTNLNTMTLIPMSGSTRRLTTQQAGELCDLKVKVLRACNIRPCGEPALVTSRILQLPHLVSVTSSLVINSFSLILK